MTDSIDKQLANLHRLGGQAFVAEMIALFLQSVPERWQSAQAAWQAGDLQALHFAAHTIKSSAGNLGAVDLAELCSRIENLAITNQKDQMEPLMQELDTVVPRTLALLEAKKGTQP